MLGKGKYGHILLGGHSRGGMISILYAARDPRISSVLAIMPSSPNTMKGKRYEDWKAKGFAISSNNVPGTTEKREFNVPFAHVIDREKFNVFEEVKNVHAPILVVAGELDAIVLPKDVKHIFDQANEPKKYLLIKGVGHAYRNNPAEIKIVNDEILKMLN
jgi:pimeloyl-ACP methyl ester carboxylesterase